MHLMSLEPLSMRILFFIPIFTTTLPQAEAECFKCWVMDIKWTKKSIHKLFVMKGWGFVGEELEKGGRGSRAVVVP